MAREKSPWDPQLTGQALHVDEHYHVQLAYELELPMEPDQAQRQQFEKVFALGASTISTRLNESLPSVLLAVPQFPAFARMCTVSAYLLGNSQHVTARVNISVVVAHYAPLHAVDAVLREALDEWDDLLAALENCARGYESAAVDYEFELMMRPLGQLGAEIIDPNLPAT